MKINLKKETKLNVSDLKAGDVVTLRTKDDSFVFTALYLGEEEMAYFDLKENIVLSDYHNYDIIKKLNVELNEISGCRGGYC